MENESLLKVFVVTEEVYRDRKIHVVTMSLTGAKKECMRAMGMEHTGNSVYWHDPEKDRPDRCFQVDRGHLEMVCDGSSLPFRIEWKSTLP
jgi:hypothetical protein